MFRRILMDLFAAVVWVVLGSVVTFSVLCPYWPIVLVPLVLVGVIWLAYGHWQLILVISAILYLVDLFSGQSD